MRIQKFLRNTQKIPFILAFLSLTSVVFIQEYSPHTPLKEKVSFDFNEGFYSFSPKTLKALSFGYSFAFSSLLWLRFWHHSPPKKMGKNEVSWIFLDLYTISVIDPYFLPVYLYGAPFISVITEDKKGAEILLKKGTQLFPHNWKIRSYLGYHYQHELLDIPKAIEQYRVLMQMEGVPSGLRAIGASLIMRGGDLDTAEFFFQDMIKTIKNKKVQKLLMEKLQKLREERAKKKRTKWIE